MEWISRMLARSADTRDHAAMLQVQTSGDPAAFAQLLARWEAPIRRLCLRMTGDHHRAEDLTQETFARVFASRASFDSSRPFSTWLWRIALNLCHEESRRTRMRARDHLAARSSHVDPRDAVIESERIQLVRDALSRLEQIDRAIVVLREYENLKFRQIAQVLEMPEGTVKWRMSEALQQLSRQLTPVLKRQDDRPANSLASRERLLL
jgi:RNA polymerase sigma-70 factor (ECF subfamily)